MADANLQDEHSRKRDWWLVPILLRIRYISVSAQRRKFSPDLPVSWTGTPNTRSVMLTMARKVGW
jgi:hypothetical protein